MYSNQGRNGWRTNGSKKNQPTVRGRSVIIRNIFLKINRDKMFHQRTQTVHISPASFAINMLDKSYQTRCAWNTLIPLYLGMNLLITTCDSDSDSQSDAERQERCTINSFICCMLIPISDSMDKYMSQRANSNKDTLIDGLQQIKNQSLDETAEAQRVVDFLSAQKNIICLTEPYQLCIIEIEKTQKVIETVYYVTANDVSRSSGMSISRV